MQIKCGLIWLMLACAVAGQDFAPEPPLPPIPPLAPHIAPHAASQVDIAIHKAMSALDHANFNWTGKAFSQSFAMPGLAMMQKGGLSEEEQMKLMAVESLMHSDPERAIPLVDKLLQNPSASVSLRQRVIGTLGSSQSPKAREILVRAAKGERNADLQQRAVQQLSASATKEDREVLRGIYKASADAALKRQVLRGLVASGDRELLLAVAKSDSSQEMRMEAIQHLGALGLEKELADLYAAESSTPVRERIMRALMSTNNSQKLIDIAKSEKDPDLRERAVRYLGSMRTPAAQQALVAMYDSTQESRVRASILRSIAGSGNAKQLIEIARKEKEPELKREAVQQLAHMKNKEAGDFLMELLEK